MSSVSLQALPVGSESRWMFGMIMENKYFSGTRQGTIKATYNCVITVLSDGQWTAGPYYDWDFQLLFWHFTSDPSHHAGEMKPVPIKGSWCLRDCWLLLVVLAAFVSWHTIVEQRVRQNQPGPAGSWNRTTPRLWIMDLRRCNQPCGQPSGASCSNDQNSRSRWLEKSSAGKGAGAKGAPSHPTAFYGIDVTPSR